MEKESIQQQGTKKENKTTKPTEPSVQWKEVAISLAARTLEGAALAAGSLLFASLAGAVQRRGASGAASGNIISIKKVSNA